MRNIRRSILVGIAGLALASATPALAADLPDYGGSYKDMVEVPAPMPVAEAVWYFKGYLGMSNQVVDTFVNEEIRTGNFSIISAEFDSAPIYGGGIGYVHSHWLRFDGTAEYRGKASFRGLDVETDQEFTNEHTGFKSEWLLLANMYWDIGTWKGVTPYIGAGIGAASVKLHDFWDINQVNDGVWWASDNSEWNFAWALHAGLAYDVTDNVTLDLAYRYVDMGDGKTGGYSTYDPSQPQNINPTTLKDIESHDLMLGVRWKLGYDGGGHRAASYKY